MKYPPKVQTKSRKRKSWLDWEDRILLTHFEKNRLDRRSVQSILPLLPGRTISAVQNRVRELRKQSEYSVRDASRWTEVEDAALIRLGKVLNWRTLEMSRRAQQDEVLKNRPKDSVIARVTALKKAHGIATRAKSPTQWSYDEDEILYQALESGFPSVEMARSLKDRLPNRQVGHILGRLKVLNQPSEDEIRTHTPKAKYDKFAKDLPRSLPFGQKKQALAIAEYDLASAKRYVQSCINYQETELPESIAS